MMMLEVQYECPGDFDLDDKVETICKRHRGVCSGSGCWMISKPPMRDMEYEFGNIRPETRRKISKAIRGISRRVKSVSWS